MQTAVCKECGASFDVFDGAEKNPWPICFECEEQERAQVEDEEDESHD